MEKEKLKNNKNFWELFSSKLVSKSEEIEIVLKGQYKEAYELLLDADAAELTPIIVGPPGVGKSILARKFAYDTGRPFHEIFFDELMTPSYLVGMFNPAILIKKGYCVDAFEPGPLLSMMLEGGVFLAQEINRASEFCQNSLLEPLEERTLYIPKLGRIKADKNFLLIATANPYELAGVHNLSEVLKDRLHVWIELKYPEKEEELEIVRINCPGFTIDEEILEKIHTIVSATRKSEEIIYPASVRASISIARLIGQHGKDELNTDILKNIAKHVLTGAIRMKTGKRVDDVVEKIIKENLD